MRRAFVSCERPHLPHITSTTSQMQYMVKNFTSSPRELLGYPLERKKGDYPVLLGLMLIGYPAPALRQVTVLAQQILYQSSHKQMVRKEKDYTFNCAGCIALLFSYHLYTSFTLSGNGANLQVFTYKRNYILCREWLGKIIFRA